MRDLAALYHPALRDIRQQVKLLDFYSVEACYPNALEEVIPAEFSSDRDVEQAIAMARTIIEAVQARMSLEYGPDGYGHARSD